VSALIRLFPRPSGRTHADAFLIPLLILGGVKR